MKITPTMARDVARKFGYVSNSQASDIEYALDLLYSDKVSTLEEAINQTNIEFYGNIHGNSYGFEE